MAKQEGPVTASSLAQPPQPRSEPAPDHSHPPEKKAAATGPATDWRVLVRHTPHHEFKTLVVKATDQESAWATYQDELRRLLLSVSGAKGKEQTRRKELDRFNEWLTQQPPYQIPPSVEILPEEEHQRVRAEIREKGPRPARP